MKNKIAIVVLFSLIVLASAANAESPAVEELKAEVAALKATVADLQKELRADFSRGTSTLAAIQNQLNLVASNSALALGPFVTVDPKRELGVAGPNVTFHGANIHIVSGSGTTNDNGKSSGLGNLIIGYDELPLSGTYQAQFPTGRTGSHNLVVGRYNQFTSFGGQVSGESNTIIGEECVVVGGVSNMVDGEFNLILGGYNNDIERDNDPSFIKKNPGGITSYANPITYSNVIVGGYEDGAYGSNNVTVGGFQNVVYGGGNSVNIGGMWNDVSNLNSVTLGGFNTLNDGVFEIAIQNPVVSEAPPAPGSLP